MNTTTTPEKPRTSYFEYLPVALFGSVMGLTGLSVAWRLSHHLFGVGLLPAELLAATAIIAFILITITYGIKAVTSFEKVKAEFNHPIASNLFGTPLISLLLIPILIAEYSLLLAEILWMIGVAGMMIFAWVVVSRWMSTRQQVTHATPAWIVPVVGLIDIPLAVPALQLQNVHFVMTFALSVGLFFAVPLFTMILSRLIFEEPLPTSMKPTLMILVAPFSVGFSAYTTTTGQVDIFAEGLYMMMLFMLSVLFGQLKDLLKCCPFRLAWWAVSFPLAASAAASIKYAEFAQTTLTTVIAAILLIIATLVILALTIRTIAGIFRGELRTLSS